MVSLPFNWPGCSDLARSTFSTQEKKDYISAVQCLYNKPSKTPSSLAPGAKNRYDDFVATHINQTLSIHGTVSSQVSATTQHSNSKRAISFHGIATSRGRTSRPSGMSAATRATSPTITGRSGLITHLHLPCSTAVPRACPETEQTNRAATTLAFPRQTPVASACRPATAAAA